MKSSDIFIQQAKTIIVDKVGAQIDMITARPLVDGCYIDRHHAMYRVRLVRYASEHIDQVLLEDQFGHIDRLDIQDWNDMALVPCCFLGRQDPLEAPLRDTKSR